MRTLRAIGVVNRIDPVEERSQGGMPRAKLCHRSGCTTGEAREGLLRRGRVVDASQPAEDGRGGFVGDAGGTAAVDLLLHRREAQREVLGGAGRGSGLGCFVNFFVFMDADVGWAPH